jgi:HPt (histidine-containing phosphotransfer) domain-containing protein
VSDRDACLAAGMDGFVSKPVSRQKLHDAVTALQGRIAETQDLPAEPATAPTDALFDEAQRSAMLEEFGTEQMAMLLEHFWGDAAELLDAAMAGGTTEPALRSLHTLKGLAATLGLAAISQRAAGAEAALKAGGQPNLDAVGEAVALTRAALQVEPEATGIVRAASALI